MSRIPRIEVPSPVVRTIPRPRTQQVPPPVVSGIRAPVIDVPDVTIEYPTIEIPPEQDFRGVAPQEDNTNEQQEPDTRDLPPTPQVPQNTIDVPGVGEVPLPDAAPLVAAGATAVVTTTVALGATITLNRVKDAFLEPMLRRLANRKKKVKIKQVKPVLHFVLDDDGTVDIYEYSAKGTKLIESPENVERYLRDQVETDSLYEYDNKIIIDDNIKKQFTKEGARRFKSLFAPAKTIAKKLSAKFSI